jgi:hypothetical protein
MILPIELEYHKKRIYNICLKDMGYSHEKSIVLSKCYVNKVLFSCKYPDTIEKQLNKLSNNSDDYIECLILDLLHF